MGFWRSAWEWLNASPSATFAESEPRPIDQLIVEMMGAGTGPKIGRAEALSVPAVLRGRNLICGISTLPLVQYGPQWKRETSPLLGQIDPDVPNVVTLSQTLEDLLFDSIAWWRVTKFGADGYPLNARHLDVSAVSLEPPSDAATPAPLPSGQDPRGAVVWVDGRPVPASQILRFDSPNPGLLSAARRPIRRALLLDAAAAMYADEPRPLDYFTPAEGADPADDDEVKDVLRKWKAARKKRSTAYVPAALKYNSVDQPSPRDLQLVELQQRAALDIANALGLDPEDLGISTTSRTYQNATDRRQDRINDVLSPYMKAITDRLSMGDVTKRGHLVRFDLDDYLRADPKTRAEVDQIRINTGTKTAEEVRADERKPPLPASAKPKPVPAPNPAGEPDDEPEAVDAAARPAATFNIEDGDGKLHFADVPVASFSVNRQTRVIEGLALPYGKTASKYGLKFRFIKGALKWTSVNRVKLLRDHDFGQALGKATDLTDTAAGLRVKFKVARGAEGDRALELAEDGVLDGLSVGVDFSAAVDTEMDDDGVMLVRRADLREVSLTAMPAFDDARVTKVAASRTERNAMECTHCGQVHAEGVACPTQNQPPADQNASGLSLSQDQVTALLARPGALEALIRQPQQTQQPATPPGALTLSAEQVDTLIKSGGLGTLLGVPQLTQASRPEPEPERRQTVDPTRRPTVTASVDEGLPYRFDRSGNLTRGKFDFSTDLIAGSQGDREALDRAQAFMREQFDQVMRAAQFDTDRADVAPLNPARQRPDMYVDQLSYRYPVWEAINKGTLADSTPFVLPKFATASGLVNNHTEGTEPTPGSYTATSQTITPTAVSGKVEITREAWEQGGSPQLSGIVWRQMVKAWFEALEAAAVAVLDAATPTQIALTAGGGTSGQTLAAELIAAFAQLQFIRGGFSMTDMFTQVDLYKALVAAKDNDGRPLFPALGPSNASGSARSRYTAVDVNGVAALPAWALAASSVNVASSYLFDREVVHGWASAPQRLQFEYRVAYVDLAIWGYKATAITDVSGVREITYDPVTP